MYHVWILVFHPQHCPKCMCTCMHGETMRCRFQGSVPSWTCLLYFGCSVEWLRATVHWFNIEKEIQVSSAVILAVFGAALVVTSKLLAHVTVTCICNWIWTFLCMSLLCPSFFFELHSHLKCWVFIFIFLELMNVIPFFFITVRCWKPACLMSLSFAF